MATPTCDRGRETAHDRVVHMVAGRFGAPGRSFIRASAERGGRLREEAPPPMPDITGSRRKNGVAAVEWLAEVETEDTLTEAQAVGQRRRSSSLFVPIYLIIPKGCLQTARTLAFRAGVALRHVFEYTIG